MSAQRAPVPLDVLLVEDNSSDRWLYAEILESRGHTPHPCEDAEGAWAALQERDFPLILLDLGLPGKMDGLELCRRIRAREGGDRPVILVITGKTEPSTLEEVLEAGADDYVQKPVDVALLGVRLAVAERSVRRQEARAEAQEGMRKVSERLTTLFRNLGDVFFSAELEPDRLLQVSPAARTVLGVAPDELLEGGGDWEDLLLPAEARSRLVARATDAFQGDRDRLHEPTVHLYAVRVQGEERWVQATYRTTVDGQGRVRRVDGMVVDVSERQRAQVELAARNREMEALARVSEQALSTPDRSGALSAALDEIRRATGFPVAVLERWDRERDTLVLEMVRGMDEAEVVLGSDAPLESPSRVVVAGGAPRSFTDPRDFVHRIHPGLRDPEPRLLLVFPLVSSGGTLGALTLLHTEPARPDGRLLRLGASLAASLAIHMERLNAQEALAARERGARELADALAQANRELEAFAHTVAHDLRAPLRTMQGFSHALLQHHGSTLPDQARDFIRRIVASGEQAEHLIADLLAYSRMSLEQMELHPVALDDVVQDALEQLTGDIRRKDARVTAAPGLPRVMGHQRTLVQVVANLVSNALKFVPDDTTPEVAIAADEEADGKVRVWVRDNGVGIPADKQDRIFRVFERLADQLHREGTGIGLAIVRRGMERINGRAGVESEEGRGSAFWIEIPALPRS